MSQAVKLAEALDAKFGDDHTRFFVSPGGKRYSRIVRASYGQDSAYAFVDNQTGLLYKPDGWRGPAKGPRGNVGTDEKLTEFVAATDVFGGYLYRYR